MIENTLEHFFSNINVSQHITIAYSGGIDSTVLLYASHSIAKSTGHRLHAIHVDHQIHTDSKSWAQHCLEYCADLNIPVEVYPVDIQPFEQAGLEGAAREARYQLFASKLNKNDVLLTAHHADDQIETVLLQLFRGSGVQGLSGCASKRSIGEAWLMRPLLNTSRNEIERYAKAHQLNWLEDPSNQSHLHDRNYLRHQVMPLLHSRWQGLRETIYRSSQWQSESSQLLDQLAEQDIGNEITDKLPINKLSSLSPVRLKNALRWWVRTNAFPIPSADIVDHIIRDVINSRDDSEPCVRWQGVELRKYRQCLYIHTQLIEHDASVSYEWNINQALTIPGLNLNLSKQDLDHYGLDLGDVNNFQVRFRRGGETMRPRGRGCSKDLKSLFQEVGVEPWLRDRIPLLFHQETLVFVWGYWISEGY